MKATQQRLCPRRLRRMATCASPAQLGWYHQLQTDARRWRSWGAYRVWTALIYLTSVN